MYDIDKKHMYDMTPILKTSLKMYDFTDLWTYLFNCPLPGPV